MASSTFVSTQYNATHMHIGVSSNCSSMIIDDAADPPVDSKTARPRHNFSAPGSWHGDLNQETVNSIHSNESALHSLATLAKATLANSAPTSIVNYKESSLCPSSMPPPPPRSKGRIRSASHPERMERWNNKDQHCSFAIPMSILETELAACEANNSSNKIVSEHTYPVSRPLKKRNLLVPNRDEPSQMQEQNYPINNTSKPEIVNVAMEKNDPILIRNDNAKRINPSKKTEEDDSKINPTELLKRARSRLLEDISTEPGVEKRVLRLPHSLDNYKEIYNKDGRIGIYTPAERAAIISKFNIKRSRRIWNKKIRYSCRKNLADRRMRVKGRFVKRVVEQSSSLTSTINKEESIDISAVTEIGIVESSSSSSSSSSTQSPIPASPDTGSLSSVKEDSDDDFAKVSDTKDIDMTDVTEPESDLIRSTRQPFRRVRRYTIT